MTQRPADGTVETGQRADLVDTVFEDLLFGSGQFTPAEVFAIREAGMRPGLHAVPGGRDEGRVSRSGVAGVEATGDVRRGDERHELGIERAAFAEVAIEIDFHKV